MGTEREGASNTRWGVAEGVAEAQGTSGCLPQRRLPGGVATSPSSPKDFWVDRMGAGTAPCTELR